MTDEKATNIIKKLDGLKKDCGTIRTDLDKTRNRIVSMEMIIEELRQDIAIELTENQPEIIHETKNVRPRTRLKRSHA